MRLTYIWLVFHRICLLNSTRGGLESYQVMSLKQNNEVAWMRPIARMSIDVLWKTWWVSNCGKIPIACCVIFMNASHFNNCFKYILEFHFDCKNTGFDRTVQCLQTWCWNTLPIGKSGSQCLAEFNMPNKIIVHKYLLSSYDYTK